MGFVLDHVDCLAFVMKTMELGIVFIIFMLHRIGGAIPGFPLAWTTISVGESSSVGSGIDALFHGVLISTGYFFFIIIIMVGMLFGDKAKVQIFLFNLFGFCFFVSAGIKVVVEFSRSAYPLGEVRDRELAMGSLAIINSAIFLADALYWAYIIKKKSTLKIANRPDV